MRASNAPKSSILRRVVAELEVAYKFTMELNGEPLDKETVGCVLSNAHRHFDNSPMADWASQRKAREPVKKVTPKVQLVVDMLIADKSKIV